MWQTGNGEVQLLRSESIEQWCLLDIRCRWGFIFGNAMYINSNYIQEYRWDGVKATLGMGEAEVRGGFFPFELLIYSWLTKELSNTSKDNWLKQMSQHSSSQDTDCLIYGGRVDGSAREVARYQPALCRGSGELAHRRVGRGQLLLMVM